MPPAPRPASPGRPPKKDGGTARKAAKAETDAAADSGTARAEPAAAKKPMPKRAPSSRAKAKGSTDRGGADENLAIGAEPPEPPKEPDRVRVFLKISAETGTSVSSCVTCDPKAKTAWALDFDGQRAGQHVALDGVYSADMTEQQLYPDVINSLVNDFIQSPRGVGCLLTYGQSEAGKETLMYGEAGSRVNLTPRCLPAPGHAPPQRAPGLVLAAFHAALAHLPVMQEAVRASPPPDVLVAPIAPIARGARARIARSRRATSTSIAHAPGPPAAPARLCPLSPSEALLHPHVFLTRARPSDRGRDTRPNCTWGA